MATGAVGPYNAAESQVTIKAIASFADVGAGNAAAMYGSSISIHRQLEIRERLQQCAEALIEEGFVKSAAGTYRVATLVIDGGKSNVVITEEAAIGAPVEANVSIAYSDSFDNAPHSTLNFEATLRGLTNSLLKQGLSAA